MRKSCRFVGNARRNPFKSLHLAQRLDLHIPPPSPSPCAPPHSSPGQRLPCVHLNNLEAGIPVLVANPQQTKITQGKKTDKLDARRIAIAHRDGRLKPSVISSQEILSLRKANRTLFKQINDATKIKQRLNQIFHQKDFKYPNLVKTKSGLQLLQLVAEGLISETTWNS